MSKLPEKISLANLPTRIYKLENLSSKLKKNIYIKRDDETGIELSGNKVRKLEFSIAEAKKQGAKVLITCGGIQSNHARATAVAAVKLGMKSVLLLRKPENNLIEGNHLLDLIVGSDVRFVTREDYSEKRFEIMEEIKAEFDKKGETAYIIPEGASNGIGLFGYINAIDEIQTQEKMLGIKFDTVVSCVGSSGTYGGLVAGNKLFDTNYNVIGINICDTAEYFKKRALGYIKESFMYLEETDIKKINLTEDDLNIIDGYTGPGYALNEAEDFEFINEFARLEGIFLDPVYTGKTLKGLVSEIKKGHIPGENILFIHTGGLYGLFPKAHEMNF